MLLLWEFRFSSGRRPQNEPSSSRVHWFNQNGFGDLGAEGKASIADEADDVRVRREEPHNLILAKTDFPQTVGHLRRSAKPPNAHGDACFNAIQRAQRIYTFGSCAGIQSAIVLHASNLTASFKNRPLGFCHWLAIF
jgi:hypothetical protein